MLSSQTAAVSIAVPRFDQALTVLNHCTLDLVRHWGLDAEQHRSLTRAVHFKNREAFGAELQKGYGQRAVRTGDQGKIFFRAIVEADGRVAQCTMVKMTVVDKVGASACDLVRGMSQFEPALDGSGRAMRSFFSTQIHYQIPPMF